MYLGRTQIYPTERPSYALLKNTVIYERGAERAFKTAELNFKLSVSSNRITTPKASTRKASSSLNIFAHVNTFTAREVELKSPRLENCIRLSLSLLERRG